VEVVEVVAVMVSSCDDVDDDDVDGDVDAGDNQRSGAKVNGEGKTVALRCCRAGVMEKMVCGGRMWVL
jgi:hypothetical protein